MELPPIDYFNQGIYNAPDEDNICLICHDILDGSLENPIQDHPQANLPYTLECKHKYHANCIITWFRSGHTNCPYCGDNGVNAPKKKKSKHPRPRSIIEQDRIEHEYIKLRNYSKKKEAPTELVKMIEKLQILEDKYDEVLNDIKQFTGAHFQNVTFKEIQKKRNMLIHKKWKLRRTIFDRKISISAYPIIPLIIPKILT